MGSLLALLALLLPFVLVGGANALTSAMFGGSGADPSRAVPDSLGATGELPERREPSVRLIRDSRSMPSASEPDTGAGAAIPVPDGPSGIPAPMLRAYRDAAGRLAETDPSCGLHWSVLAAIGRVESGHARSGRVDGSGTTATAILGPRLNGGEGFAAVPDTDSGELDGDPVWDRAVGAMQFLPSTWSRYGVDGNDDGVASPHNAHDATLAAGRYLCEAGGDLSRREELARAVFEYNHSERYVRDVLGWATAYRTGGHPTPAPELPELGTPEPEPTGDAAHPPAPSEGPAPGGQRRGSAEFPPLSPAPPPSTAPSFEPIVPETAQRPTGQHPTGQHPTGQRPAGDHSGGNHSEGQRPTGQHHAGHDRKSTTEPTPEPTASEESGFASGAESTSSAEPVEDPARGPGD